MQMLSNREEQFNNRIDKILSKISIDSVDSTNLLSRRRVKPNYKLSCSPVENKSYSPSPLRVRLKSLDID